MGGIIALSPRSVVTAKSQDDFANSKVLGLADIRVDGMRTTSGCRYLESRKNVIDGYRQGNANAIRKCADEELSDTI